MSDAARRVIGIDLGATRIKVGVVSDGELVHEATVPVGGASGDGRDSHAIIETLAALVDSIDPDAQSPIGIAAAGVIDQRSGIVRESPNFPSWRDFPLSAELAARTARQVYLDNDANAVILGEATLGVARGTSNVFGYTLGTGVGGGIVIDGRPYRGERGMAAELGHVTVEPRGRACGCGNHGCLERYAGQHGIITTLSERGGALAALLLPDPSDAPRLLADLADRGDAGALAIFAEVGRYLGQAAAAVVHTLDITTIVLAGGIAGAFTYIAPAMEAELRARTFRSMSEGVRILNGTLGTRAGVLGAAALSIAPASSRG